MAKIKLGPMIVGIRGTIAGITFSANQSGDYAKKWARSSNPRTALQTTQRNRLAAFASVWRNLTAAQRTAWATYAALPAQQLTDSLGLAYFTTGFNWFVSVNTNLQQAALLQRNDPPVLVRPTAPIFNTAATAATTSTQIIILVVSAADPQLGKYLNIDFGLSSSLGRTVQPINYITCTTMLANFGATGFLIQAFTAPRLGAINANQRAFFRARWQDTQGQRSPYTTYSEAVVP